MSNDPALSWQPGESRVCEGIITSLCELVLPGIYLKLSGALPV